MLRKWAWDNLPAAAKRRDALATPAIRLLGLALVTHKSTSDEAAGSGLTVPAQARNASYGLVFGVDMSEI